MTRHACSQIVILAALLAPFTAEAANPTFYTARANFNAAVTVSDTDDYNTGYVFAQSDAAMTAVHHQTSYTATGFANNNIVSGGAYCAGCNGSFRLTFTQTTVGTPDGVFGVGVDIPTNATPAYFAFITFGDNTTANIPLPGGVSFFGVTVAEGVKSIHFGLSGGATTQSGSFQIDNLTLARALNCGNGSLSQGEECDDGNSTNGDGCENDCRLPRCDNGIVDVGEACDDHNNVNNDGCSADCKSNETCGNGIVDVVKGETCDDGNTTAGDGCSATCKIERCGNSFVDPGEVCDDGNTVSGDNCSSDCKSNETCGNGIVDVAKGEACDDGNTTNSDGCEANCSLPSCGNGVLDPGEACDDGNHVNGDGCNATCMSLETCGNGIVDTGEQCDDTNTTGGDGCSPLCKIERCGNGVLDVGEACDDGNAVNGDGCNTTCSSTEVCGNGIVDVDRGESCDDGANNSDLAADGCRTNCKAASCGDNVIDTGEDCDLGAANDDNGACSKSCTVPPADGCCRIGNDQGISRWLLPVGLVALMLLRRRRSRAAR